MAVQRKAQTPNPATVRRAPRPLPRKPVVFPVPILRKAVGWVLGRLRERHGFSPRELARRAKVGPQTVRDLEQGRCPDCAWTTCAIVCHALHRRLADVERIAHRLLWWEYRRQQRVNRGRSDWKMIFPWASSRRAN